MVLQRVMLCKLLLRLIHIYLPLLSEYGSPHLSGRDMQCAAMRHVGGHIVAQIPARDHLRIVRLLEALLVLTLGLLSEVTSSPGDGADRVYAVIMKKVL